MKYETERRQLLKLYPIKALDSNTRKLEPDFFPEYLLEEVTEGEIQTIAPSGSKIKEDFNLKLEHITRAIAAEI